MISMVIMVAVTCQESPAGSNNTESSLGAWNVVAISAMILKNTDLCFDPYQ